MWRSLLENVEGSSEGATLAVLVDGCITNLPSPNRSTTSPRSWKAFLLGQLSTRVAPTEAYGFAAQGASIAAHRIANDLPCYREKLIPVDIYALGKDELGDPKVTYQPLIDAQTVDAGQIYCPRNPVTGISIRQGARELPLILRRPTAAGIAFRKVVARVDPPIGQNEPVRIEAAVRPGQGYAKVSIRSESSDVFSASLNWRDMEACKEPTVPPLAYLPGVMVVEPHREMWNSAESAIRKFLALSKYSDVDATHASLKWVNQATGKVQLADKLDSLFGRRNNKEPYNPFRFYGAFPSSLSIDRTLNPKVSAEFGKALATALVEKTQPLSAVQRNRLMRAASWMYLNAPLGVLSSVRSRFKQTTAARLREGWEPTRPHANDLAVAGMCWKNPSDLMLLFEAIGYWLPQPETQAKPNNWLRSLQNVLKLREHALADQALPWGGQTTVKSEMLILKIVEPVLRIAEGQLENWVIV